MARKESKMDLLLAMLPPGWEVHTWSPGDGKTRYRFFRDPPKGQTYFGPASGTYTALGYKEATTYASGLRR